MNLGILTGGGDCPGLNAVIRAVVQRVHQAGFSTLGILEGWKGLVQDATLPLTPDLTDGLIGQGGTILGSSRTNPFKEADRDLPRLLANLKRHRLDGLVVIGGDDTLGVAHRLKRDHDVPVVGVPKTIDNDLNVTEFTFGFDTAVNIVMEAIDRLRTTTESHRRVMVVETMGRQAGWIAAFAGIAVGADYILVPEVPADLDHCCDVLTRRRAQGKHHGIVVVSEGVQLPHNGLISQYDELDSFGNPRPSGIGPLVARVIEDLTNIETRAVILGHLQRGGAPTASDRILATRMGLAAADLALHHRFGRLVALSQGRIVDVPLDQSVTEIRKLDPSYYEAASAFFR